MKVFSSKKLAIYYRPELELLEVTYGNIYELSLKVIVKQVIGKILPAVRKYKAKYLLLDSSKAFHPENFLISRDVTFAMAEGLLNSPVKKVARLGTGSFIMEFTALTNFLTVKEMLELPFQVESFTDREEAEEWLMAWKNIHVT